MTACTHTGGTGIHRLEITLRQVPHSSRCVVHITSHQTDVRESHVIKRHILFHLTPFHLFHTEHAFIIYHIRIGTIQTGWLIDTVIIQYQFIFCRLCRNTINHFHRSLVIPVKEIHLKAFDSHFSILPASLIQLRIQHIEHRPEYQLHSLALSISNQFRQIQFRNHCQHIPTLRVIPTLVQYDIFQSVPGSKIDIILICIHVDTCFERYPFQVPVIPPVPCYLTRLYPGTVSNAVRRSQCIYQIIHRHFCILFSYSQDTPRIRTVSFYVCNVILRFRHILLLTPRIEIRLFRIRSKHTFQCLLSIRLHKHSRISFQVRLQQCHLRLLAVHRYRQKSQFLWSL